MKAHREGSTARADVTPQRRRYRRRPLVVMPPEFVALDEVDRREGVAILADLFARHFTKADERQDPLT